MINAQIGANQHVLEFLDRRRIERTFGDEVRDRGADRGSGAFEPRAQPREPGGLGLVHAMRPCQAAVLPGLATQSCLLRLRGREGEAEEYRCFGGPPSGFECSAGEPTRDLVRGTLSPASRRGDRSSRRSLRVASRALCVMPAR